MVLLYSKTSSMQSLVKNFPKAYIGDIHKYEYKYELFASVFSDLIPQKILQEMYIMTLPKIEYLLLYV